MIAISLMIFIAISLIFLIIHIATKKQWADDASLITVCIVAFIIGFGSLATLMMEWYFPFLHTGWEEYRGLGEAMPFLLILTSFVLIYAHFDKPKQVDVAANLTEQIIWHVKEIEKLEKELQRLTAIKEKENGSTI